MDTATTVTTKWQSRIEQRRNKHDSVASYVDGLIRANHVSIEDVAPFLTADELYVVQNAVAEIARQKAEAEARAEAERLQQAEARRKLDERLAAFRQEHPFP